MTNGEVLIENTNDNETVADNQEEHKIWGYVMRKEGLENLMFTGYTKCKRNREKQ